MKRKNCFIVAIDGPAASGKSTIAKKVAIFFNFQYINTGKLYRILALKLSKQNRYINKEFLEQFPSLTIDDYYSSDNKELYSEEIGKLASILAAKQEIRSILLDIQRELAYSQCSVLDGRDIGSIVCPDADIKFFITAKLSVRARRRFKELISLKKRLTYKQVLLKLIERDIRDTNRSIAPLTQAEDAIYIDSSYIKLEQAFNEITKKILVIK
ncbi:MAG: cytidylate kinase [Candidatus Mesenet longicola]|uniref:Cytidylate kinase n=1 Tax=Candidatus Mesenet longicola TaxID=1892558 RepID=A0A8J3HR31_9RICK|nr:MAG: cytidylate kinase [Candidatus Mesenet longicola]GHM60058.1 MAG: cytidylate kinase [Candidatus Mesenet longicola]